MKISRIKIENFRGHKCTEVELADHHVLVGENASGKTAVLEAINYATSPYYSWLQYRLLVQAGEISYRPLLNYSVPGLYNQ